jgi:hypothetical protein
MRYLSEFLSISVEWNYDLELLDGRPTASSKELIAQPESHAE